MKRIFRPWVAVCTAVALAAAACLFCGVLAQEAGLRLANPINGKQILTTEGQNPNEASLVYTYPQFTVENEADEAINRFFRQEAGAMLQARAQDAEPPERQEIGYRLALNTQRYVSVLLYTRTATSRGEYERLDAYTFARDGVYAGQALTLSQVLGLEQETGAADAEGVADETLAESLCYDLVWQIIERGMQDMDGDYLENVTREKLRQTLHPEQDFYLDEEGNVVLYIQAGEVAGEIAGTLLFPFAPAELLSAIKES